MSFGAPLWLLLLALPAAAVLWWRRRAPVAPALRWPSMQRVAVAGGRIRERIDRARMPALFSLLAIVFAILALARPQWGEGAKIGAASARDVFIALDLSRSMLADDVGDSRLAVATEIIESLLDALDGERVGLIVFAGTAFVQVPLSPDDQIIREFLPELEPDYMPKGGSDFGALFDAAVEGFGEDGDASRFLVMLSDGEPTVEGWQEPLDAMAEHDIRVVALGIGTPDGSFIPDGYGGYWKSSGDETVRTHLDMDVLQVMARRTNGQATAVSSADDIAARVADIVGDGERGGFVGETGLQKVDRYQWLLLPAILLAALGLWRELPRRALAQAVRRRPAPTLAAGTVAALLALWFGTLGSVPRADAHFDQDAEFSVREEFESNPIKRLTQIVDHLAVHGYDAYDIRLMVEETIKYGLDERRTELQPDEGVIRDAIEATHEGEALDTTVADWSFYRSRLQDMLPAPEQTAEAAGEPDRKPNPLDEEDNPPTVAGQSTQTSANDSFGTGAASRSDQTLGDLTAAEGSDVQPGKRSTAAPRMSGNGGGGASRKAAASNPILDFARKRMKDVMKRDSPARLHQLLNDTGEGAAPVEKDW